MASLFGNSNDMEFCLLIYFFTFFITIIDYMTCSFLPEIISPSRLWSFYISSLNFFSGSLLSFILCICPLQFILYCVNLSLILKIPNCSLMSLFLLLYLFVIKILRSCTSRMYGKNSRLGISWRTQGLVLKIMLWVTKTAPSFQMQEPMREISFMNDIRF
jgi:hypothetical protein